jgi:IS30 family transposase
VGKHYSHFSWNDRLRIETLTKEGMAAKEIAARLRCHISSIYREWKRGRYTHKNSDWTYDDRYSPDIADERYRAGLAAKGGHLKIGKDRALAEYIEKKIIEDKYSPAAAVAQIRRDGIAFSVTLSAKTIYRYIDRGIFLRLTNRDLPVKSKSKRPYHHIRAARPSRGESIEQRPAGVNERKEIGHWEMDTVKGKATTKRVMLVLTERVARKEIQIPMASCSAVCVAKALDDLEKRYGDLFPKIFRSITVDNGSEFSDCAGMEKSCLREGKRTKLYYCHPYSSWERGSNENQNRMIRRWIPKGTPIEEVPDEKIEFVEKWLNDYPRRIHGWQSANDIFSEHLAKIADTKT